ncbi:hypothetical protein [Methylomonas sp. HYX-M1]|uniref:hypothetical protein n=1 Tax=Methylomonas sp. HYX-M1 TaxID=3139307 RepID=UPI00345BA9B2
MKHGFKYNFTMKPTILACAALLIPAFAFAARPFVTDDARLTTGGSCQLESWLRIYPDSQEIWALPACNPTGNLEFTIGGGVAKYEGESTTNDYVFQAKTLLRRLETNDWGLGLGIGTILHPEINPGPNQLGNTYAYIPLSVSLSDDKLIIHANVGWLKDKASGLNTASWGIGAELKLHPNWLGIAETYGDNHGNAYGQTGVRYSVIPNLFQIDATFGLQISDPDKAHWISFGIRYTPDKLL